MKCIKCGTENGNNVLFCGSCGAKLSDENNNDTIAKGAAAVVENESKKHTGNETLEKIGKFLTGGLATVAVVMVIGAFLGFFDKNPIPFLIFIGVVLLFGRLEDKFPKLPAIVIAVLEIIALIMCFNIANDTGTVASVKGGCPNNYPNITYERAFEDYFANPVWEKSEEDDDGNEVVKFTGNCSYLDETAVAEIKFTVYKEQDRFVVSSVKINGTDMGLLGNGLIADVFEEYEQKH